MTYIDELAALTSGHPRGLTSAEIAEAIARGQAPALASEITRVCRTQGPFTAKHVGETLRVLRSFGGAPITSGRTNDKRSTWRVEVSGAAVSDARPVADVAKPGGAHSVDAIDPRSDPKAHALGAPNGYHLRGVSTLLNADGVPVAQWVKTAKDAEQQRLDALLDAIKSLPDSFREAHEPTPAPVVANDDLLCIVPIGDPHLACLAWAEETGQNYDLKIAERIHLQAVKRLVELAPPAKQCLIISLGDFFHADNNLARTERSGNPLDTDSRHALALRVGIRLFRAMIDTALAKFEKVSVIIEVGNHDMASSLMLALAMDAFYANDPRVFVDTSPEKFHWYRFGKNLIGTTHGDGPKPEALPLVMAHDRAEDWGQTRHRKLFVGHWHQERVREFPGVTVEWFRTLAGRDAWAHGNGYRSGRDMRMDVYHREHGLITRHIVGIEQLEAE